MGNYIFRQFISTIICLGIALPGSAATNTKTIKTKNGNYTIIQYTNRQNMIQSQIVLAPDSRENSSDLNNDGLWDHWELERGNITAMAGYPVDGHYGNLSYTFRMQKGYLRTDFIYEQKTGTYRLLNKNYEPYKIFKAEDIVIGRCSTLDSISSLATNWNNIYSTMSEQKLKNLFDSKDVFFIDQSCREGKFVNSLKDIKSGMAEVLASSVRKESKSGRFLQCMDNHGLGIHADRIRGFLYSKVKPDTAADIANDLVKTTDPQSNRSENTGTGLNITTDLSTTQTSASNTRSEAENREESLANQKKALQTQASQWPMVRCSYQTNTKDSVQRGLWNENTRQITLTRLAGDFIPTHEPKYSSEVPKKNTTIPFTSVDSDDYAKAFFHELIHSSFIESEEFTESIENCCSLPNGFDWNVPACEAMQKLMERASGQQSFIYAINQKHSSNYSTYHQDLIGAMKGSVDLANKLEGDVINRFKTRTDQANHKTVEGALLESKAECDRLAESLAEKEKCLAKFNNDFYSKMHSMYEEECDNYVSVRLPLNCKKLATSFLNVFGSCKDKKTANFQMDPKWQYVLNLLLGKMSSANEEDKCACFEIAHSSRTQDLSRDLGNIELINRISTNSLVDKPGKNSSNYNKLSKRPVTKAMLDQMTPVPNAQITKEFTQGYERRSTKVMDSALSVLNRVKNEILPRAEAQTISYTDSGLASRLKTEQGLSEANGTALRISDPFNSSTTSMPIAGGSTPVAVTSTQSTQKNGNNSKSSGAGVGGTAATTTTQLTGAATSAAGVTTGAATGASTTTASNSSVSSGAKTGHNTRPGSTASSTASTATQSAVKNGGDSTQGISSASLAGNSSSPDSTSNNGTSRGISSSASSDGRANSDSRAATTAKNSAGSGLTSGAAADSQGRASAQKTWLFASTDDLLRFLTGPYRPVNEALPVPSFVKILIDHNVKVVNHAGAPIGAKKPTYILQFNPANGSLNLVKWK